MPVPDQAVPIEVRLERGIGLEPHHHVEAQRELSFVGELLVAVDGGEARPGVVKGGDAFGERIGAGELHHLAETRLIFRRRIPGLIRDARAHQSLRRLLEQPGGFPAGVLHDLAARRIGRLAGHPGKLQRLGVDERRVTAGVLEDHRVRWAHAIERGVQRHPFDVGLRRPRPLLLVPPPSLDEATGRRLLRRVRHLRDDVVPGLRLRQVEDELRFAERRVVAVALDEAGNGQPAAQIDHFRAGARELLDLRVAAHRDDAISAHGDGLGAGPLRVDGEHVAVEEHEVCRPLLSGRRSTSHGDDKREDAGKADAHEEIGAAGHCRDILPYEEARRGAYKVARRMSEAPLA